MAMSDTSSNPSDWVQYYQGVSRGQVASRSSPVSSTFGRSPPTVEATVVSTTAGLTAVGAASGAATHLNAEGRIGKSSRRRCRASKRPPTTLLNTDPTNFRAMVQQFTGAPTVPLSPTGMTNVNFELSAHHHHSIPTGMMVQHAQQYYYHQQQQQQQQQLLLRREGDGIFSLENTGDVFLPRIGNSRSDMEILEGFLQSGSTHMSSRPTPTDNRTNG